MANWKIKIEPPFLGYAPGALLSDYPSYGDARQAGDMTDVDITDPNCITQGAGLSQLTNGGDGTHGSGVVTTNLTSILDQTFAGGYSFGVGGDYFYEIQDGEVTSGTTPTLPHEINSGSATAKDVAYYKDEIFYSWYSGSGAGNGDVGKYDMSRDADADFDDDWASDVKSATLIEGGGEMPLEVGEDDKLYLGHNYYVGMYDGSTFTNAALDIPTRYRIRDIRWNQDRLFVAANSPSTQSNTGWISVNTDTGDWTNGENAYSSNDSYATTSTSTDAQQYANSNGRSAEGVPSDATITGIEIRVEGHVASGTGNLEIRVNNNVWGTMELGTATDTYYSVGGSGTIYGLTYSDTPLTIKMTASSSDDFSVDHIQYKIYYTQAVSGKKQGSVFIWNPYSEEESWEQQIMVEGEIGALFVHNGVNYIFYKDNTYASGLKIGVLTGGRVRGLGNFTGSLPERRQITAYKNFIIWVSDDKIWAYGSPDPKIPKYVFQLTDTGYATTGALASPFGTPMISSTDGTNYQLAQFTDYATTSVWKSLMFPVGASTIDKVKVFYDTLEDTPAQCDLSITYDRGSSSSSATYSIEGENDNVKNLKTFNIGIPIENDFRVELDWSNGSADYPVKINKIEINGSTRETN